VHVKIASHIESYRRTIFDTLSIFLKQYAIATVMVAISHIAAATQTDPPYLPGGANVHRLLLHSSMSPRETLSQNGISIG